MSIMREPKLVLRCVECGTGLQIYPPNMLNLLESVDVSTPEIIRSQGPQGNGRTVGRWIHRPLIPFRGPAPE